MQSSLRLKQLCFSSFFCLSLLLSACGGSSSGGSTPAPPIGGTPAPNPPAGGFSVSIDRSELRFAGEEEGSIAPQVVLGTGAGTMPSAIYLGSLDLGTAIGQVSVETVGMQVKYTVYPKSNLAAGDYSGSVQLFACPDEKCTTQFAGSPVNVPYKISVAKAFKVTPSTVSLSALSGTTATASIAVQPRHGVTSFTAVPEPSATWLSVSSQTANAFTISAKALAPGSYIGTLQVRSGDALRNIWVYYVVTADATTITSITPDLTSLSFAAPATTAAPSRTVNVAVPTWTKEATATIRYLTSADGWLSVVKTGERSVSVTASAGALQAGTYHAEIRFSTEGVNDAVVPVSFAVGAASWNVGGVTRFKVTGDTTSASLAGDLQIAMPGLPAQGYNATSNASWLKLSRPGGTTGGAALGLSIDSAVLLTLANFQTYTADVTISALDTRIAPTKVTVTLEKMLPELHYVSPHTRMPNEAGEYILRGRGLNSYADIKQSLGINGATPLSVTRMSDLEVRVKLAGAASGEVRFSVPNLLGATTSTPSLRVVAPTAYRSATVLSGGDKGNLVFDPVRQSLYSANKTLQSVMRFAWDGSGWVVTSTPLPGVDAVALAPDGKQLVATVTPGSIVLLDPHTLEKLGTYTATWVGGSLNSLLRLAVTNDGRAYFQGNSGLSYFDLVERKFGSVEWDHRWYFSGGPWFSLSGDGSRLNIVQGASSSPAPLMLTMDTTDSVPKMNPSGLTFWYEAAQSLRGERFVEGTYKVYDRDFALIGNLALPSDTYFGRTPVVSPDGARTYVMAYPSGYPRSSANPRVYVFDSSTRMVQSTNLPLMGSFDLPDYPTCRTDAYECNTRALGTISPDGKTLFFIGSARLVVAPVPQVLTPSAQRAPMQRASAAQTGVLPAMTRLPTGR